MKRLGGWWRIWFVISSLIVAFSLLSSLDERELSVQFINAAEPLALSCVPFTKETFETSASEYAREAYEADQASQIVMVDDKLLQVYPGDSRYQAPQRRGISKPEVAYEVRCTGWFQIIKNLWIAAVIAGCIALAGLSARWIYRGFKKNVT